MPTPPTPNLQTELAQLLKLTQACNATLAQKDWPTALQLMAERQPLLQTLEEALPLPASLVQHPNFAHWQQQEHALHQAMIDLNHQRSQLEQVFAQIQSARQQLMAYHIAPTTTDGLTAEEAAACSVHNQTG
jgi:DNA repair exonuclease SbcCD ATPase subunit